MGLLHFRGQNCTPKSILQNAVIVSDDPGQFTIGQRAFCWVHAERLAHKLDIFTDLHRAGQEHMRVLIWWFDADLKAYRADPSPRRRGEMLARFDRIFARRTGCAMLDRLPAQLPTNKPELLLVLDRPEIPLHINGSERDIHCPVIKRKISGGTHNSAGRDAFLGLMHTCSKLGIAFWDYLGDRLDITRHARVPALTDFIHCPG
jgi:Transposase IS66 family